MLFLAIVSVATAGSPSSVWLGASGIDGVVWGGGKAPGMTCRGAKAMETCGRQAERRAEFGHGMLISEVQHTFCDGHLMGGLLEVSGPPDTRTRLVGWLTTMLGKGYADSSGRIANLTVWVSGAVTLSVSPDTRPGFAFILYSEEAVAAKYCVL